MEPVTELHCYIGGTMRPVMEKIIQRYEESHPVKVFVDYAGSGELLIRMQQTERGDLYVAHDPFDKAARIKGLSSSIRSPASLTPIIAVPKGNPMGIRGFDDLISRDISILVPNAIYSTTGQLVNYMAGKLDMIEELDKNVASRMRCPCDAANALTLDNADAAVVWNAVAWLRRDKLDALPIAPEILPQQGVDVITSASFGRLDLGITKVNVMVLDYSKQRRAAEAFAAYAAGPESADLWKEYGFSSPDGGEWKE